MHTTRGWWLVLGLLVSVTAVGCSATPEAKVGDPAILSTWSMPDDVTATEFQIPTGTVTIGLGRPVTEEVRISSDKEDVTAPPEGGSFVPIGMDFRQTFGRTGAEAGASLPMSAVLIADGRSYPLPNAYEVVDGEIKTDSVISGWYLPVAGPATEQSLAVTYDGLTQTFDLTTGERDAGVADVWYGPQESTARDCPTAGWTGEYATFISGNCIALYGYPMPYFADLGWAAPGHRWLVLSVIVDPRIDRAGLEANDRTVEGLNPLYADQEALSVLVSGRGAVGSAGHSGPFVYSLPADPNGYQIFDVEQGTATISITSTVKVGYLGEDEETTGDISLSFDIEVV